MQAPFVYPYGLLEVPNSVLEVRLSNPGATSMQKHLKYTSPLFDHMPCVDDVIQGNIGDCYLLAGLNSILFRPQGPEIILHLMKDNRDGTVTIRFFRDARYHYVRIKKSVVHEYSSSTFGYRHGTGKILHSQGALWVQLLEKAYLAFMRGANPTYRKLKGGAGEDAAVAFLGGPNGYKTGGVMDAESAIDENILFILFEDCCNAQTVHLRIPSIKIEKIAEVSQRVFPEDDAQCVHGNRWYDWNDAGKREAFRNFKSRLQSLDAFLALMSQIAADLDVETRDLVIVFVTRRAADWWPGEMGSGIYTSEQLDLFAKIQRMLATQHAVTAGTSKNIKGPISGEGKSGESMVLGLATEHEYTVIDTKTDVHGRKFVKIRNPWGSYGRSYTESLGMNGPGLLTPVADPHAGEFWVELVDFKINFGNIGVGPRVETDARRRHFEDLAGELQRQADRLRRVDGNLVNQNNNYTDWWRKG